MTRARRDPDRRLAQALAGNARAFREMAQAGNSEISGSRAYFLAIAFELALKAYPDDDYFNTITLDLKTYPVTTEVLFVALDPSALDELDVMVGPRADQATVDRVTAILAAHAPNATVSRSRLNVR